MKSARKHGALIIALVMVLTAIPSFAMAKTSSDDTQLKRPVLTNHAASKTSIKNTWKKVKGAKGYEVYRATKAKGKYKKVKTIKNGKTVTWTNKKLKEGKNYFYKVRAYKLVKGKKQYSKFSTAEWAVPTNYPNWEYSISGKTKTTKTLKLTLVNKSRYSMSFYSEGLCLKNKDAKTAWDAMAQEEWENASDSDLIAKGIIPAAMAKKITIKPGQKKTLTYKTSVSVKYTKSSFIQSDFRYNKKDYGMLHSSKYGDELWIY
ncbi:hypothetical protein LI177_13680 [bacterium 210820-DFI.6.37]|nr:hypothetical protein [bacterium 210820-DFI.6.37]